MYHALLALEGVHGMTVFVIGRGDDFPRILCSLLIVFRDVANNGSSHGDLLEASLNGSQV